MSYQYRCEQCRTTSPPILTRTGLTDERDKHRLLFHGGHIPDGEMVIEPDPFHYTDIPRSQWVMGSLMVLALIIATIYRLS
ncbi:hypothetical protein [Streptomyces cinereoruber]|uniref:hypothetical protein n=1 Tax=Streptomyces cinereoruber TaxID=67260 RepID=UPI003643503B